MHRQGTGFPVDVVIMKIAKNVKNRTSAVENAGLFKIK